MAEKLPGHTMNHLQADDVISITIPVSSRAISPMTQYASIVTARDNSPWFDIAHRYDVRTMTGPQALMFASDLIDHGVDATEALGITWPIANRNLFEKIGHNGTVPKIDNWYDVQRHLQTQRDVAFRGGNTFRVDHYNRLIDLAGELGDAA